METISSCSAFTSSRGWDEVHAADVSPDAQQVRRFAQQFLMQQVVDALFSSPPRAPGCRGHGSGWLRVHIDEQDGVLSHEAARPG